MNIKTIKGAILAAKHAIKKMYNEAAVKEDVVDKEDGLIVTEFSIFFIRYIKNTDKEFSRDFPEVSHQMLWNEGIKIDKRTVLQFSRIRNDKNKKLSILFVLPEGTIFQISPLSLIGFCETMNLEIKGKGIYYFFPTILLTRLKGKPSEREILTKKKLSIIAQINDIEGNTGSPDFSDSSFNLRDFDSDVISEIVQALKNINNHLSNIEKKLYRRKKQ